MTERNSLSLSPVSAESPSTAIASGFELLKPPLQLDVFRTHPVELRRVAAGGDFARSRARSRETDRLGVSEVGVNGGDDNARFNRNEIDSDEGNANPRVDDDTLVQSRFAPLCRSSR